MSNPYQVLDNSTADHQQEGQPSHDGEQVQLQPMMAAQPPPHQPQQPQFHAIGMPDAQHLPVVASYPIQPIQPVVRQVLMDMPVHIGPIFRGLLVLLVLLWIAMAVLDLSLDADDRAYTWVWMPIFYAALIWYKLPTRCEISPFGATVYTRGTFYALSFSRMTSIHVVRSSWCWAKDCCTFPRTSFTSTSDSVFFRGDSCGTSLGFSPLDLQQFLNVIQQTAGGQKMIEG